MLTAVIASFFLAASTSHARGVETTDDLGQKISLAQPARRIIPLYGAFAEMLFSIGAGDRVIARTQADKFPPELASLPSVGTHMRPNVEMILGLKPDLVVMSASRREETPEISRVLDSGIPVAVFSPRTFEEIFSVTARLGILSGTSSEASAFTDMLRKRLDAVRDKLAGSEGRRRVFFEIRAEPLTGAGRGSIVQAIITASGGENVLKNEKAIVSYSLEALLFEDPDFYIVQEGPMNKSPMAPGKRSHFDRLKCVREGRIIIADELLFSRPGPRCVEAVERLAAALYPERFQ
ncbi:MAG: ABC transporter substrate-binding protein [Syntrophobacteraceae bacterium]